jgi:AcrR family transcriptional regulator
VNSSIGGSASDPRAGIVARLRARRTEIDQAIFARVSDRWFERTGSEDPEYVAGLRAAGVAALDYALLGIERSGGSLEPVPVVMLEQARRAARVGVGLDTVLRRYLAGYAVFEGFVMQEAERDRLLREGAALRDLLRVVSALVDRLVTAVSRAYGEELERDARMPSPPPRASPGRVVGPQRDRILRATVEVVAERGVAGASVKLVLAGAGVSSRTFYECFTGLDECLVAIVDGAFARLSALASRAFEGEGSWVDGMRVALASVLWFLDSEPALARVMLVETLAGAPAVREHRQLGIDAFRALVVERIEGLQAPAASSLVPEGVLASVIGIISARLIVPDRESLIDLLGPLMGIVVEPFMREQHVAREIERGNELARKIKNGDSRWARPLPVPEGADVTLALPSRLANPDARRLRECMLYVAGHRGCSNSEVAAAIGVSHKSQISTLLSYLHEEGLVEKSSAGSPGMPNVLSLTTRGEEVARELEKLGA